MCLFICKISILDWLKKNRNCLPQITRVACTYIVITFSTIPKSRNLLQYGFGFCISLRPDVEFFFPFYIFGEYLTRVLFAKTYVICNLSNLCHKKSFCTTWRLSVDDVVSFQVFFLLIKKDFLIKSITKMDMFNKAIFKVNLQLKRNFNFGNFWKIELKFTT
jgi:hypothetical protein